MEHADKQNYKDDIRDLGLRYHLVTPFTAFVAIEQRTDAVTGEMKLVHVHKNTAEFAAAVSHLLKAKEVQQNVRRGTRRNVLYTASISNI